MNTLGGMRWLVTLECLDVPARTAIEKALQSRCGLSMSSDDLVAPVRKDLAAALVLLLRRIRGLASSSHKSQHPVLAGPWLSCVPHDPASRDVYRRVARAVAETCFGEQRVAHLMLCVRACPDEAFESIVDTFGHSSRETSLQELRWVAQDIGAAGPDDTPFDAVVRHVDCPRYAADTPCVLRRVVDEACRACEEVLPRSQTSWAAPQRDRPE